MFPMTSSSLLTGSVIHHQTPPPTLLLSSGPADGDPLRFVLGLLDDGAQLHAGVLQVVVHQHAVKELFVLGLHQLGRLLQLHKVVRLQEETSLLGALLVEQHVL